ncbi:MAG: hypothetical protein FWC43_14815 [Planctomycetaceae bacterium]|nr:hypothetical protein [Planctomycetaceae bacterium]
MDESGFSLSPICGTTWAEIGKPPVLRDIQKDTRSNSDSIPQEDFP